MLLMRGTNDFNKAEQITLVNIDKSHASLNTTIEILYCNELPLLV